MATTNVLAIYEDRRSGLLAARDLTDHGFDADDLTIISGGPTGDPVALDPTETQKRAVTAGAGIGAAVGMAGGLLAGLAAMTIPGIGAVVAAGPLLAAAIGGSTGALAGALVGGMIDLGVPEHHAHAFLEGVRNGGTLVICHGDRTRAHEAAKIMQRRNPMDVGERAIELMPAADDENVSASALIVSSTLIVSESDASPRTNAPPRT